MYQVYRGTDFDEQRSVEYFALPDKWFGYEDASKNVCSIDYFYVPEEKQYVLQVKIYRKSDWIGEIGYSWPEETKVCYDAEKEDTGDYLCAELEYSPRMTIIQLTVNEVWAKNRGMYGTLGLFH